MTFDQLSLGSSVFLDSNTFVYHFEPNPTFGAGCSQLMARIENQEILGFTSTHTLTEVAHRLMMIVAASIPGWQPTKVKRRLAQNPALFKSLHHFKTAIDAVLNSRVQLLTTAPTLVSSAASISQTLALLSSDALVVAIMQQHGLVNLASNDADFDRVPWITRYAPQ